LRYLLYGFGLLLALLTASCGNSIFSVGTPVVILTAQPGRFTSYIVTIDAIVLTRDDGNTYTLPMGGQRVDLANLKAFTNVLAASPAPIGTYPSAQIQLDYVNPLPAFVTVDYGGQAFPATVFDATAQAAATFATVNVKFDPKHPFVVADQKSQVLNLDIDLEASNIIGPPVAGISAVTVKPFLNVSSQPTFQKQVMARGLYVLADTANSNIVMNLRPLHDVVNQPLGALKVNVDANTYYNVNGVAYVGPPGLAAISALTNVFANLQIGVYGPTTGNPFADLTTIEPTFTATQVYVGSSLESTLEDQITGIVTSVSGSTVTVGGAAFVDRLGDYGFTQSVPVTVSASTIYSVDGVVPSTPPSLATLSVGQVVTVQGIGNSPNLTDYNPVSLDATGTQLPGAQIRIQDTPLVAQFNAANGANAALVNLATVFNYEATPPSLVYPTADPTNYAISTPTDISATAPGAFLKIHGMTTPGNAGPPFFNATSVSTDVQQQLVIEWTGNVASNPFGSVNPFSVVNSTGIVVNLADAALTGGTKGVAVVRSAPGLVGPGQVLDLLANPPASTTPTQLFVNFNTQDPNHPPLFGVGSIAVGSYVDTDTSSFFDHEQAVNNNVTLIQKLVAYGQYDPTTGVFSATTLTINAQ
jgi:hypothetical protein